MIPVISFIGRSGSGKTSLLENIVTELIRRRIKVAVIKHSHHENFEFDKNGKDSRRLIESGADTVILSGPRELVLMKRTDHDFSMDEIMNLIDPDIELILTEGFKKEDTVKIEVHRKALEPGLLARPDQLLAVITDEFFDVRVPQFDLMKNNTPQITDLIEKWLSVQSKRKMGHPVNNKLDEIVIV